jgi:hypothetical protein
LLRGSFEFTANSLAIAAISLLISLCNRGEMLRNHFAVAEKRFASAANSEIAANSLRNHFAITTERSAIAANSLCNKSKGNLLVIAALSLLISLCNHCELLRNHFAIGANSP